MEETLYRYNPWWQGPYRLEGVVERPRILEWMKRHLASKSILFLTGLRRVGKTTLLKILIEHLLKSQSAAARNIFYVSLDDYLLSKKSILEIIEGYRKIHKIPFREKVYLFLDEIAYQPDFEQQLKNLYDNQNVKIYASSSSASILKSKKHYLTGRHLTLEVLPLDFNEYLRFKKIEVSKEDRHLLESHFEDYLKTGGLPEYLLWGEMDYLRELVDDIIYKDIASFHGIRHPEVLKDFFLLLMERAGKVVSINKIANILDISVDSAKRYLQMFADTYLIYFIARHGKTNEKILAPKKIYAADLGIRTLFTGFRDKGSLFENYVYLKIRDQKPSYVYEDGLEVDFLTRDGVLIEVKYGSKMEGRQAALFEKFKAKKKVAIHNFLELEDYLQAVQNPPRDSS
jgi:predicted AAA+ superfamily ATPase